MLQHQNQLRNTKFSPPDLSRPSSFSPDFLLPHSRFKEWLLSRVLISVWLLLAVSVLSLGIVMVIIPTTTITQFL